MIRDEISQVIGLMIPPRGWRNKMYEAMISGSLDQRKIVNILITLCEHVEKLEPVEEVKQTAVTPKQISLYNPMDEDFIVAYDVKGDKNPENFTVHSREIESFEQSVGEHILKHLVDFVAEKSHVSLTNREEIEAIKKQVVVTL